MTGDNRTPPKGIEVIGELPPGTPWWDAPKLGFKTRRVWGAFFFVPLLLVSIAFTVATVALLVSWFESGRGFALWPIGLGALALWALLPARRLFGYVLHRYALVVDGEVVRHPLSLDLVVNSMPPQTLLLSSLLQVTPYRRNTLTDMYGVSLETLNDQFWDFPTRFLQGNSHQVAILLNYRIAHAKGANPPPPDLFGVPPTAQPAPQRSTKAVDEYLPPLGIKVRGVLPVGVPWWDADHLEIGPNRLRLGLVLVALVCLPVFLWAQGWAVDLLQGENEAMQFAVAMVGALYLLYLLYIVLQLRPGPALVIIRDQLRARPVNSATYALPPVFRLANARPPERLPADETDSLGMFSNYKFEFGDPESFEPNPGLNADMLGVEDWVLAALLTYRIARAKGENPAPPEFS